MRTSNYKKIKFTKSAAKKTGLAVGAILLAGIIFFFSFFRVTHVEVMENTHYSKKELKKMILTGAFSSNSILAPITCSKAKVENVPYVESYSVSRSGRNSIVIGVKEMWSAVFRILTVIFILTVMANLSKAAGREMKMCRISRALPSRKLL